mgnify:CR=1 FL=1
MLYYDTNMGVLDAWRRAHRRFGGHVGAAFGIGADEQRAQTLGVNTRLIKIAGFAMTAAVAGAVGAAWFGLHGRL